jgi:hypothetical protein
MGAGQVEVKTKTSRRHGKSKTRQAKDKTLTRPDKTQAKTRHKTRQIEDKTRQDRLAPAMIVKIELVVQSRSIIQLFVL